MKTINMIAETIQQFLSMIQNVVAGGNEISLIFKDSMEQARAQAKSEFEASMK
jgi:hypothetical protein